MSTQTFTGSLESGTTNPSPTIEVYLPEAGKAIGIGLIILPGGGYEWLAPHEGAGYAEHFQKQGIACFVVSYRLGNQGFKHPAMLEDALAAIETIRKRAGEFGVDPTRIGLMGSSAGGHLTAHILTAYSSYASSVSLRPDFGVLCYPVITMRDRFTHQGSRNNLIGTERSVAVLNALSCEEQVKPETPPCFIWHTWEDTGVPVENALMFAAALRRNDVPFELHVYQKGGHGLGLNTDLPWAQDCLRWMKALK
jgi:acetyl esterase/lipase